MKNSKIIILTTGQPSTNPRMVKEYQALKEAGYEVKVFYSYWQDWAVEADNKLFSEGTLHLPDFTMVGGSPFSDKFNYNLSRVFHKLNKFIYAKTGWKIVSSTSRVTSYLTTAARKTKADLYIAHNIGALPAAVAGAKKWDAKAGFDAEDFHRGDFKKWESPQQQHVIKIEDKFIPLCNYLTAGSPLIGAAYEKLYIGKRFLPVNNVFSKRFLQSIIPGNSNVLSLFWFSQTVGPYRGIEAVVHAMNLLPTSMNVELYLLGQLSVGFDNVLLDISLSKKIHFLPPSSPNEVFAISAQYDIGLSIEIPYCNNKDFCLANKMFTYMLAGNCIVFSDTSAQVKFLKENPGSGFIYKSENKQQLAALINRLYENRTELLDARSNARQLASLEFNWEKEGEKVKQLVKDVLMN